MFVTTAAAHVLLLGFAVVRLRARASVPFENKGTFQPTPIARASTPETAVLPAVPPLQELREVEERG